MNKQVWNKSRNTPAADVKNHDCGALGCPLIATASDDLRGAGAWYCRYHFGVIFSDWGLITNRINKSLHALEWLGKAKKASSCEMKDLPWQNSSEPLSKKEVEKHHMFVSRIKELIDGYIRKGVEFKSKEELKKSLGISDYVENFKQQVGA